MSRLHLPALLRLFPMAALLACDSGTAPEPEEETPPSFSTATVHRLVIAPVKARIDVGEVLLLVVTAYDAADRPILRPRLTWGSSDPTVLAVSDAGVATGVTAGYVFITVHSGSASALAAVHVQVDGEYPNAVFIDPPSATSLSACSTVQLTARTSPDIHETRFRWRSSDTLIARVSDQGLVTGGAPGDVVITSLWAPDTSRRAFRDMSVLQC